MKRYIRTTTEALQSYLDEYSGQYDILAQLYTEHHGISKYSVKGKYMIYNVSYPAYLSEPRRTYQFKVDLDTYQSSKGVLLDRFDKSALVNR